MEIFDEVMTKTKMHSFLNHSVYISRSCSSGHVTVKYSLLLIKRTKKNSRLSLRNDTKFFVGKAGVALQVRVLTSFRCVWKEVMFLSDED